MADANDPGLLTPAETSLLVDQYEISMAASFLREGKNEPSVFELFVRRLPPHRDWLLVCGLGPTLRLITEMRFGDRELEYAQLIETLLLNQVNFQTMIATKAARVVLAANGDGESVIDFSPRRDHGVDAAMKAARASAVAGIGGTSNVAAAMRYGLRPMGTMAHSYVLSFEREEDAFEAFMRDNPDNALLLVDTYDTIEGVRRAIDASRRVGVPLSGIRIDSGDLPGLAWQARKLLDDSGFRGARIVASGDLEEHRIAEMCRDQVPVDVWGVGTELGTSRDSPVVNGVYKIVADLTGEVWRGVAKHSEAKETLPGAKQVFRRFEDGTMIEDVDALADEKLDGEPLLVPAIRMGEILLEETLEEMRERTKHSLQSLPISLRGEGEKPPFPVRHSDRLTEEAERSASSGEEGRE